MTEILPLYFDITSWGQRVLLHICLEGIYRHGRGANRAMLTALRTLVTSRPQKTRRSQGQKPKAGAAQNCSERVDQILHGPSQSFKKLLAWLSISVLHRCEVCLLSVSFSFSPMTNLLLRNTLDMIGCAWHIPSHNLSSWNLTRSASWTGSQKWHWIYLRHIQKIRPLMCGMYNVDPSSKSALGPWRETFKYKGQFLPWSSMRMRSFAKIQSGQLNPLHKSHVSWRKTKQQRHGTPTSGQNETHFRAMRLVNHSGITTTWTPTATDWPWIKNIRT